MKTKPRSFVQIPFRYKIQLAVLAILLTSLGCYVLLASHSLEQEKKAGLLEYTRASGDLISVRARAEFTDRYYTLIGVLAGLLKDGRMSHSISGLLAIEESSPTGRRVLWGELTDLHLNSPEKCAGRIFSIESKNRFSICLEQEGRQFFAVFSGQEFLESNKDFADAALFLVDTRNKSKMAILGPDFSTDEGADSSFLFSSPKMTETRQMVINRQDYIFALAPIAGTNIFVALGYPQVLALGAVKELQVRSLYFAILVFGLTSLLAYWIGANLSKRLELLAHQTALVARGELDLAEPEKKNDEVGALSYSIYKMARDLKKYIQDVTEKSRMEAELKTAQAVQHAILPHGPYEDESWTLHGFYKSASECGGDFWHYWKTKDSIFFIIADATGHGAPAALVTSAARSALSVCEIRDDEDLQKIVMNLDHAIRSCSRGEILMTAIVGRIDQRTGVLTYYNCSHEPVILIESAGVYKVLFGNICSRLGDQVTAGFFEPSFVTLGADQGIFLYTDGLSEALNSEGQVWGEKRFYATMTKKFDKKCTSAELLNSNYEAFLSYTNQKPSADDVTMMLIRRR